METAVNARVRRPHAGDIVVGNVLHDFEGGFGWEEEYFDADTISRYDHRLDMYQGPAVCCHSDHLYCVSLPPTSLNSLEILPSPHLLYVRDTCRSNMLLTSKGRRVPEDWHL